MAARSKTQFNCCTNPFIYEKEILLNCTLSEQSWINMISREQHFYIMSSGLLSKELIPTPTTHPPMNYIAIPKVAGLTWRYDMPWWFAKGAVSNSRFGPSLVDAPRRTSELPTWGCLKMLAKPLKPMVLLIIIPIKWLFHWEYTIFSDKSRYLH